MVLLNYRVDHSINMFMVYVKVSIHEERICLNRNISWSPGGGGGGKTPSFLGRGCSTELQEVPTRHGSGRFQTLRSTVQKRTCRQPFNQFNEAKENNIKYFPHWPIVCESIVIKSLGMDLLSLLYDTEQALKGTAMYANVKISSLAP